MPGFFVSRGQRRVTEKSVVLFCLFFFPFSFLFPYLLVPHRKDGAGWLQQWTNHEAGAAHTKWPCLHSQAQHWTTHGPEGCSGMPGCWSTPGPWTTTWVPIPSTQPAAGCFMPLSTGWFFSQNSHSFCCIWFGIQEFPCPIQAHQHPPEQRLVSAIQKAISSPNAAHWKRRPGCHAPASRCVSPLPSLLFYSPSLQQ